MDFTGMYPATTWSLRSDDSKSMNGRSSTEMVTRLLSLLIRDRPARTPAAT